MCLINIYISSVQSRYNHWGNSFRNAGPSFPYAHEVYRRSHIISNGDDLSANIRNALYHGNVTEAKFIASIGNTAHCRWSHFSELKLQPVANSCAWKLANFARPFFANSSFPCMTKSLLGWTPFTIRAYATPFPTTALWSAGKSINFCYNNIPV